VETEDAFPAPRAPRRLASRAQALRALGLLGAGAWIAILAVVLDPGVGPNRTSSDRAIAVWVADRDADRIHGLDADLIRARSFACRAPLALRARRDGGLWVLRARERAPGSRQRVERRDAQGDLRAMVELDSCVDLERDADDAALVIEARAAGHTDRAWRVRDDGSLVLLLERDHLSCATAALDSIALGTSNGDLVRIDARAEGRVLAEAHLDARLGDLAPGPEAGTLWALDVRRPGRLYLLEENLDVRWSVRVELSAAHLAPVLGEERVWLCDGAEPRWRRFGPSGVLELERSLLPLGGLERALAWTDGGVVWIAPGAVMRADAQGRSKPGQGGFNYLVDLDRVP
jgi:hypothetical protein